MCLHPITFWPPDFLKEIIFPIVVAFTTYLLFKKIDEWKARRTSSALGVLIIESLIEEVNTGLALMNDVLDTTKTLTSIALLPNKSWAGMTTISDDVLLRIIQSTKNITPVSFPPRQIRSHCKNYFTHMNSNWELHVNSGPNWRVQTQLLLNGGYLEATQKVLAMLEQTKSQLDKNSKKLFPK